MSLEHESCHSLNCVREKLVSGWEGASPWCLKGPPGHAGEAPLSGRAHRPDGGTPSLAEVSGTEGLACWLGSVASTGGSCW